MRWPLYWIAFLGTLLLFAACDIPTDYTVNSPNCPWPPPRVSDSTVALIPLGYPRGSFGPAVRRPAKEVTSYNQYGNRE